MLVRRGELSLSQQIILNSSMMNSETSLNVKMLTVLLLVLKLKRSNKINFIIKSTYHLKIAITSMSIKNMELIGILPKE